MLSVRLVNTHPPEARPEAPELVVSTREVTSVRRPAGQQQLDAIAGGRFHDNLQLRQPALEPERATCKMYKQRNICQAKEIGQTIPRMDDLDAGFHVRPRPIVRDRTPDSAEPKAPFYPQNRPTHTTDETNQSDPG
ncbi:hypothetical protein BHM03_00040775 [Ensete ventricosum]|nr:hypothetical protein BHM03_00040775 [Ensete ventricosum]